MPGVWAFPAAEKTFSGYKEQKRLTLTALVCCSRFAVQYNEARVCLGVVCVHVDAFIGSAVQFSQGRWLSFRSQACGTESLSKISMRGTGPPMTVCYFWRSPHSLSHLYMSAIGAFVSGSSTSIQHLAFSWGDVLTLGKGPTGRGWFLPTPVESPGNGNSS